MATSSIKCSLSALLVILSVVAMTTSGFPAAETERKVRQERGLLSIIESVVPLDQLTGSLQGLSSGMQCFACKVGVKMLLHMVNSGDSSDRIQQVASGLCRRFRLFPDQVCDGVTNAYKDQIVEIFSRVKVSPTEVCQTCFVSACGSSASSSTNWTVALPNVPKPPVVPVTPPKPGSSSLRVLHLSDVHLDLEYKVGANAACQDPLCCREGNASTNPSKAAGQWGDYRNCDTPLATLENLMKRIAATQKIDMILWTGDDPPHNVWSQVKDKQIEVLQTVAGMLRKYFSGVAVFPALGNHEGVPVNSFPLPHLSTSIDWLYDALATTWTQFLPAAAAETIRRGGFYSVLARPGLRIISLNMNYCNNLNWYLFLNATDPLDELQWLVDQLQAAETSGERVYILGHIPPGMADCLPMWSYNYYRVVSRYESTIRGQFFGHTHVDEFELFYDTEGGDRPVNVAYVGPSVTPYDAVNPAFRVYTVDGGYSGGSWAVLDHETYSFDLDVANRLGKPKWNLVYTARDAYNMSALQPTDWHQFLQRLKADDATFSKFYRNYHRGSSAFPACDADCKRKLMCSLASGQSKEYFACAGY